jgi:leader peptidase (prepilin peptidase)/N-methyltransferase
MKYFLLFFAAAVSVFGVLAFNRLPERWFCDYGAEVPAKREQRLKPLIAIPVFFAVMAAAWYFGLSFFPNIKAFAVLLFVFFCLCASAADIVYKILPDQFIMAIAASALVFPAVDYKRFYIYLLGALAGALVIFLIGFLGKLFFKTEAMGFGDVKLNAALGLACGLYGTLYALLIAILTGALAAVPLSLFSKNEKRYLPFAPFLCLGAVAAIFFKRQFDSVFNWYISLF